MKTITLRLDESTYKLFSLYADHDNRTISNMIETAAKRHLKQCLEFVSDQEMNEVNSDKHLLRSIRKGNRQAKKRKGRLIG